MSLEENRNFEESLRQVRPAQVDPALSRRIESGLAKRSRATRISRIRSGLGWTAMAVAATILVVFGLMLFNGRLSVLSEGDPLADGGGNTIPESISNPSSSDDESFKPVFAENNLKNRIDEGIVFLRNGLAARRYRYEFIDRVVWQNPSNGAVVEMEIPRDEVVLVPVQTF